MNDDQFIVLTSHRLEHKAQGVIFTPETIFAIRDTALQRLANRVAVDDKLHTVLYKQYDLVLDNGEAVLFGLEPTLLLSKEARKFWFITMTDVVNSVKLLPTITDLRNPPPISSYYYATVFQSKLLVRDSTAQVVEETEVQLFGSYVPLIADPAFEDELKDDIIDEAVAVLLETSNPEKVNEQAQKVS